MMIATLEKSAWSSFGFRLWVGTTLVLRFLVLLSSVGPLFARMAVAACRILVAVGLLSCILIINCQLGENRVGLTEYNSARYVHCITQPFAYDEYCSQPNDSRKQHLNVFPGYDPFEGIAPFMGARSACARSPNGTVTFGSANMSHLANWDTRAAVGYLSFQLLLVIASGCITWRSSCIRFVADSRQRFIPWLALFFALSIGVQGQLASSPWPMFGGDAAHTGRSLYNGPTGPAVIVKWNYTMTGQVYCFPAIGVDGTVYTSSFGDSNVVALTGTTGAPKWNYTGGGMFASTPAIGGDGTIYVGSYDKKVYALNATTGALKWNYTTGSDVSSPAIGVDGTIYMSCLGRVYALNGTTGAVKWITSASGPYVASSPAIGADGTVYGSFANVHAFDGVTGAFKWSTEGATSYGMRWSFPAIGADGTVFVCSWNNVYAFDGGTGALKWVYSIFVSNLGNSLSPAIGADGTVYVGSSDGRVFALNGATGTVKWNYFTSRTASSPVIGRDGTVYVVSADSKVYALDGITGVLKWSFAIAGGLFMSPVIGADGTIYLGSQDNKTYAIVDCPSGQYCTPRASSWSTYVLSDGNSSVSVSISRPEYGTIFSPGFFPSLVSFRPAKFFLAKSPSPAPGIVEGRTSTV